MTARVEINLNLRLSDNQTMADLDEDVSGELNVLDEVSVHASALGLVGRGWVTEIDAIDRTVTLQVEWSGLRRPDTRSTGLLTSRAGQNWRISQQSLGLIGV